MEGDSQTVLELLQRRLDTLELLRGELLAGQKAFVEFNLEAVHQHIGQQVELCAGLRRLDVALTNLMRGLLADTEADTPSICFEALGRRLGSDSAGRLPRILQQMESVRFDVQRLNRMQAEFLRRSRRNTGVLLNLVMNCMGTYSPPKPTPAFASSTCRGA